VSSTDIPAQWVKDEAGTVFKQVSTSTKKVKTKDCDDEGKYPVIDQGQLPIAGYVNDDDKVIQVESPLVIFGDHTRVIKWVQSDFVPGADGTKVLDPIGYLYPRYFYYHLRAIELPDKGYARHFKFLKESVFFIPPFAEQKQIAAKLDELLAQVDSIKTRLDAIPAILKRFRQSVLAAAVSGRLTEEWRGSSDRRGWVDGVLGDFVKKPSYGTSSKSQKVGEVPVLRMGNLQDGKLDWSDLVYTSDASEIKKYRLQSGDVLFNRTNSPELVGKTSIYRGEREAIYAGYLIRIQCDEGLDPEFLNYHLNSPGAKDYCHAVKSDGVSQSNINAKKLVAYALNKPPFEEQAEIIRRVGQYFTFADQIEQRVKDAQSRVNHLTQSILAKAFRGELTAEWREQNPDLISGENSAQALLECIKTEQAKLKKPKKKARKKSSA
jgi:type I restriction enzyme, S subunit